MHQISRGKDVDYLLIGKLFLLLTGSNNQFRILDSQVVLQTRLFLPKKKQEKIKEDLFEVVKKFIKFGFASSFVIGCWIRWASYLVTDIYQNYSKQIQSKRLFLAKLGKKYIFLSFD